MTSPLQASYFEPKPFIEGVQPPILLVHGYLHNSSAWLYLRRRLKTGGLGPIYTIDLGSPFHTIEEYAEKVRLKAEQIAQETGQRELALIGHSMGGLVSAYYATHIASEGSVPSVITIGSPLQGTKIAVLGIGPCAKQMRYGSDFTKELTQNMALVNTLFFHIGSKTDFVIRPTSSALLQNPNSRCYEFKSKGHIFYLYSNAVADKILEFYQSTPQH